MKKLLCMLLMGTMTLSLAGCGGSKDDAGAGETGSSSEAESSSEAKSSEEGGSEEIATAQEGKLIMATNAEFPPYEFYEGDEIVGIDAEIAAAVAEELGLELQIEDMAFDAIITAVTSGKADIGAAGMTVTPDREENVSFTDTYAEASQVVIVPEGSEIASPDDLAGKKIGVQLGTTGDIYSADVEDATVERYNKGFEAVQSLQSGKIDAVVIDEQPAKVFVEQNEGLEILPDKFTEEEYAIACAKDNTELVEKINGALESLRDSGALDEIVSKYIAADSDSEE